MVMRSTGKAWASMVASMSIGVHARRVSVDGVRTRFLPSLLHAADLLTLRL